MMTYWFAKLHCITRLVSQRSVDQSRLALQLILQQLCKRCVHICSQWVFTPSHQIPHPRTKEKITVRKTEQLISCNDTDYSIASAFSYTKYIFIFIPLYCDDIE